MATITWGNTILQTRGGRILSFGGIRQYAIDARRVRYVPMNDVFEYNPLDETWSHCDHMPRAAQDCSAIETRSGDIYVGGGRIEWSHDGGIPVHKYTAERREWILQAPRITPNRIPTFTGVLVENPLSENLMFISVRNTGQYYCVIHATFNTSTETWSNFKVERISHSHESAISPYSLCSIRWSSRERREKTNSRYYALLLEHEHEHEHEHEELAEVDAGDVQLEGGEITDED